MVKFCRQWKYTLMCGMRTERKPAQERSEETEAGR